MSDYNKIKCKSFLINVWKLSSVDATLSVVGSSLQSREIVVRVFQRRKRKKRKKRKKMMKN